MFTRIYILKNEKSKTNRRIDAGVLYALISEYILLVNPIWFSKEGCAELLKNVEVPLSLIPITVNGKEERYRRNFMSRKRV